MLKRFKHFLKIINIFIAYIHQILVNVSNKDNGLAWLAAVYMKWKCVFLFFPSKTDPSGYSASQGHLYTK